MSNLITVGIGDFNFAGSEDVLVTYALGSCVGICLYEKKRKIAALAHIMLPYCLNREKGMLDKRKYADTCLDEVMRIMKLKGITSQNLTAKIAGGAQMFSSDNNIFCIGQRNIDAVKEYLFVHQITIIADETGGDFGRTLYFKAQTGEVEIRSAKRPVKII